MAEDKKNLVIGMALNRDRWVLQVSRLWLGALGESAKNHCAKLSGYPYSWEPEVGRLMKDSLKYFNPKQVKLKSGFDLYTAGAEAFLDAAADGASKVHRAKRLFEEDKLEGEEVLPFLKAYDLGPALADQLLLDALEAHYPKEVWDKLLSAIQLAIS